MAEKVTGGRGGRTFVQNVSAKQSIHLYSKIRLLLVLCCSSTNNLGPIVVPDNNTVIQNSVIVKGTPVPPPPKHRMHGAFTSESPLVRQVVSVHRKHLFKADNTLFIH